MKTLYELRPDNTRFVPQPYGMVAGHIKDNLGDTIEMNFMAIEWLKDFIELHRGANNNYLYLIPNYLEEKSGQEYHYYKQKESTVLRKKVI
jgi:hypothetical protein